MIRPKLPLRRPLAILGAAFVGLTAALAVAAPASAHHSEVKVKGECDTATGEWVVTWTVRSVAPHGVNKFKFTAVEAKSYVGDTATDIQIPGIAATQGEPGYPHPVNQDIEATHRLPGETTAASLRVKSKWENGYRENKWAGAKIEFTGTCEKEQEEPPPATAKPTATVGAECDGSVVVKLKNGDEATAPAEFTVRGSGDFEEKVTVAPGETKTVTVPADKASKIKVTAKGKKKPLFEGSPAKPEDCVEPGEPALSYALTCDELVWEVDNPADGKAVTVTFTPSTGEPKTVTVQPGKTETVSFPASEGLTVTPSADGVEGKPVAWEKPADCAAGGGGGDLPLTGAAAGGIAAAALLLVGAGIVLFVLARRRRVTFTA